MTYSTFLLSMNLDVTIRESTIKRRNLYSESPLSINTMENNQSFASFIFYLYLIIYQQLRETCNICKVSVNIPIEN